LRFVGGCTGFVAKSTAGAFLLLFLRKKKEMKLNLRFYSTIKNINVKRITLGLICWGALLSELLKPLDTGFKPLFQKKIKFILGIGAGSPTISM